MFIKDEGKLFIRTEEGKPVPILNPDGDEQAIHRAAIRKSQKKVKINMTRY